MLNFPLSKQGNIFQLKNVIYCATFFLIHDILLQVISIIDNVNFNHSTTVLNSKLGLGRMPDIRRLPDPAGYVGYPAKCKIRPNNLAGYPAK